MRYFPTNEFNYAQTTIQLFHDVARQARYGSDQVGELPKELWDECEAVSGFWIRGMGRYCGRGFVVVGYGTNKKNTYGPWRSREQSTRRHCLSLASTGNSTARCSSNS
jgi:hypothetical protein